MKHQNWLIGPAILALALSTSGSIMAQGDKPAKEGKAAKKAPAKRDTTKAAITRETNLAGAIAGKPLTDDQKTQLAQAVRDRNAAISAAQEQFRQSRAKILGLTAEDVDAREKDAKAKIAAERKQAAEERKKAKAAKDAG